jgi:hypothetical protein
VPAIDLAARQSYQDRIASSSSLSGLDDRSEKRQSCALRQSAQESQNILKSHQKHQSDLLKEYTLSSMTMADRIGPDHGPKRSFGEKCRRLGKAFTTKYDTR